MPIASMKCKRVRLIAMDEEVEWEQSLVWNCQPWSDWLYQQQLLAHRYLSLEQKRNSSTSSVKGLFAVEDCIRNGHEFTTVRIGLTFAFVETFH